MSSYSPLQKMPLSVLLTAIWHWSAPKEDQISNHMQNIDLKAHKNDCNWNHYKKCGIIMNSDTPHWIVYKRSSRTLNVVLACTSHIAYTENANPYHYYGFRFGDLCGASISGWVGRNTSRCIVYSTGPNAEISEGSVRGCSQRILANTQK